MERDELEAWLRLTLSNGVGNTSVRRLLTCFGSPEAIFTQPAAVLAQVVSLTQADTLRRRPAELNALLETTWAWLREGGDDTGAGRHVCVLGDARYPRALLDIEDPPVLLYMLGQLPQQGLPPAHDCIAMVGSRNPTPQGADNARALARQLHQAGLTVVSGLALGVDGAAHAGALDTTPSDQSGLATIAVIGTGVDIVYPSRHKLLSRAITQRGTVLSEYPIGTPPLAANFPKRNRIIAGLCCGTVVVEAALQSGSLITARLAAEQGRDVFALPGSIHSPQSRGCHALIKQGAKLVESAQDILEELRRPAAVAQEPGNPAPAIEAAEDNPLLRALGHDPVGLDALLARTGLSPATLQAQLMVLELDGQVTRLPGALFQRSDQA